MLMPLTLNLTFSLMPVDRGDLTNSQMVFYKVLPSTHQNHLRIQGLSGKSPTTVNIARTVCVTFFHGNYSDDSEGSSYGQLVIGSFIRTTCPLMYHILCKLFLAKHQITQVTQLLLQPRFGALQLLAFLKTKITFEREEISDH